MWQWYMGFGILCGNKLCGVPGRTAAQPTPMLSATDNRQRWLSRWLDVECCARQWDIAKLQSKRGHGPCYGIVHSGGTSHSTARVQPSWSGSRRLTSTCCGGCACAYRVLLFHQARWTSKSRVDMPCAAEVYHCNACSTQRCCWPQADDTAIRVSVSRTSLSPGLRLDAAISASVQQVKGTTIHVPCVRQPPAGYMFHLFM